MTTLREKRVLHLSVMTIFTGAGLLATFVDMVGEGEDNGKDKGKGKGKDRAQGSLAQSAMLPEILYEESVVGLTRTTRQETKGLTGVMLIIMKMGRRQQPRILECITDKDTTRNHRSMPRPNRRIIITLRIITIQTGNRPVAAIISRMEMEAQNPQ
jgi:hypothetical protein